MSDKQIGQGKEGREEEKKKKKLKDKIANTKFMETKR